MKFVRYLAGERVSVGVATDQGIAELAAFGSIDEIIRGAPSVLPEIRAVVRSEGDRIQFRRFPYWRPSRDLESISRSA